MYRLFLILSVSLLGGCFAKQEEAEPAPPQKSGNTVELTDAQLKNAGILTGRPAFRDMQGTLKVNGLVDVPPQNKITVSFPSGGYLKSTGLLPGMRVKKGQVLAVMEDQSFVQLEQDFLTAQVRLVQLQKEYERQKLLNASKSTSDKVFEQTSGDYQSQRILVKSLQEKLLLIGIRPEGLNENTISRNVNIYAPITGYITAVHVNPGKYVSPSDILFELIDPDDLHLVLTVFEKDVLTIHPGQKIKTSLVSDASSSYEAEVRLVGKLLDSNRSVEVHCHFTGPTPPLFPGMFVNAEIAVTNSHVIAVSDEAVVRSGEKEYVFVQEKPAQFGMIPVTTGASHDGFTAITSAATDLTGKIIITKNAYAALMKLRNLGD
ncbi:MAG: efflux RND transporter periplasmic adaptor subunit [Williamsia sp.]|nr:efflux RND transporter periplasmic adaptor subunit [Williamsia sp.]